MVQGIFAYTNVLKVSVGAGVVGLVNNNPDEYFFFHSGKWSVAATVLLFQWEDGQLLFYCAHGVYSSLWSAASCSQIPLPILLNCRYWPLRWSYSNKTVLYQVSLLPLMTCSISSCHLVTFPSCKKSVAGNTFFHWIDAIC